MTEYPCAVVCDDLSESTKIFMTKAVVYVTIVTFRVPLQASAMLCYITVSSIIPVITKILLWAVQCPIAEGTDDVYDVCLEVVMMGYVLITALLCVLLEHFIQKNGFVEKVCQIHKSVIEAWQLLVVGVDSCWSYFVES